MSDPGNKNRISSRAEAFIAWGLVLLCTLVYFSLTRNNNVWMDEAFTATLVRTDLTGVLTRSMNDTLPPLYNILLKLFTDLFGYRVPAMKLFSSLFMSLTAVLGATVIRKRFGLITSVIFILSLILMPNMLFFAVEIRMYSLGFFCATACGIYAFECISQPCKKNRILFTMSVVLSGYSHHFAFVTAGFVCFLLLLYYLIYEKKQLKAFFLCILAVFVLYLPCLLITLKQLKQVSGYFSMPEITPAVFIKYMRYPFTTGFTPLSILLLFTFFLLVLRSFYHFLFPSRSLFCDRKRDRSDPASASDLAAGSDPASASDLTAGADPVSGPSDSCAQQSLRQIRFIPAYALVYYCVLLFGTAVSKVMTANIFVDRYLFFATGLLWLFVAIEVSSLKKLFLYFILALELLSGVPGVKEAYRSEYAGNTGELIEYLSENVHPGDLLYTLEDAEGLSLSLPFYDNDLVYTESLDDLRPSSDAAAPRTLWCAILAGYEYDASELDGWELEYAGDFSFDRYQFTLYKMKRPGNI